jgi:hypothetical protein
MRSDALEFVQSPRRAAFRAIVRRAASGAAAGPLFVWGLAGCAAPEPPAADLPNTGARMGAIVSALEVALPAAQSSDTFAASENRAELRAALRELARNASALELHRTEDSPGFRFFSRRLADDAAEISKRFSAGSTDEARFLLNQVVDDCAGCHARLPDPRERTLGVPLTASLERVPPRVRAKLLVATRQFDAALDSYEALFASRESSLSQLDFEGALEDYLNVALRVRGDLARAERTLAALQARGDAPPYLAPLLAGWRAALAELAPVAQRATLVDARGVLGRAAALRRYPADRSALVHDLIASSLLHRALARGFASPDETAEATYLLGIAELRSDPARSLPQAEAYLEAAIRAQPGGDIARDAYALLEEQTLLAWMGSGGLDLPPDVGAWLGELREIARTETRQH